MRLLLRRYFNRSEIAFGLFKSLLALQLHLFLHHLIPYTTFNFFIHLLAPHLISTHNFFYSNFHHLLSSSPSKYSIERFLYNQTLHNLQALIQSSKTSSNLSADIHF